MTGPRVVLVAGTDTGVGKTVVAAGLLRVLRARGRSVVAVKPVESGCSDDPEAEDGAILARAAGQTEPRAALVRLREPLAPPVAAEREGVVLDHRPWAAEIRRLARGRDLVLVEGAGGLLSPLTWECSALDLARELGAAALVVGADRLGVQNHVLLTERALAGAGVEVLGAVLSAPGEPDASTGGNGAALRRLRPDLRVISLPRLRDAAAAAERLGPVADWLAEGGAP